jgi:hypothetical protein
LYSGIKIYNNLPTEIKNVADNFKKFKIALKQFLYTYSLYTLEECFNQSQIMYCITKIAYYIGISFAFLSYGTLYKYSFTVYYDLISFPCINLMSYLCFMGLFIKLLIVFDSYDLFFTVHNVILMTCFISILLDHWNNE